MGQRAVNTRRTVELLGRQRGQSPRRGGVGVFIAIFFLLTGLALGALWFLGAQIDSRIAASLEVGMKAVEKDRANEGFEAFAKARAEMNALYRAYRPLAALSGKVFHTPEEVDQMMISALLMTAYSELFYLKPAVESIQKAEDIVKKLSGADADEFRKTIATVREVSDLVNQLVQRKFEAVMKGLLAAEKNALPTDQDFFIMEVRLLIACGKGLGEPAITKQARELLWFISSEAGIKGPKIDKLWGLLNR